MSLVMLGVAAHLKQLFLLECPPHCHGVERGHVVGHAQQKGQLRVEQKCKVHLEERRRRCGQTQNDIHQEMLI